jgi:hypothetical protein
MKTVNKSIYIQFLFLKITTNIFDKILLNLRNKNLIL